MKKYKIIKSESSYSDLENKVNQFLQSENDEKWYIVGGVTSDRDSISQVLVWESSGERCI